MLTTIIYRSHICDNVSFKSIEAMVARANERNGQADVTGILLFNGTHFFNSLRGLKKRFGIFISIFAAILATITWWSFFAIMRRPVVSVMSAWNCLIYANMIARKCCRR
jgi:hypothetical protein